MTKLRMPDVLGRIQEALDLAVRELKVFVPGRVEAKSKRGRDPVTEADHAVNRALQKLLVRDGEGWLSEESEDDLSRLGKKHVWIVDPLDGTREFVAGIPEWCVSVAYVIEGTAVAGGVTNPATGETFLGSTGSGIQYNGRKAFPTRRQALAGATVLASGSEVQRGEWDEFRNAPFTVKPVGSVAYKLARVAAGLADATWTLTPKHEWDVAGGVALIQAAGGFVDTLELEPLVFNGESTLLSGLVAGSPGLKREIASYLGLPLEAPGTCAERPCWPESRT